MTINVQEILQRKLGTMFPDDDARAEIIKVLNQYGIENHEKEIGRVQLDILKLAGTSSEAVRMWVEVAKKDYRDILAAAEYPIELISPTWKMAKNKREANKDRARLAHGWPPFRENGFDHCAALAPHKANPRNTTAASRFTWKSY